MRLWQSMPGLHAKIRVLGWAQIWTLTSKFSEAMRRGVESLKVGMGVVSHVIYIQMEFECHTSPPSPAACP